MQGNDGSSPAFGRWDGHTHSQFAPHGPADPTEEFLERAIALGFERYSVTEHAPLPQGFPDPTPDHDNDMDRDLLLPYLEHVEELRGRYAGRIDVACGLEVDYLPGFERGTGALLDQVGPRLDDALLSLHFLPAGGRWWCLDYSAEDFASGYLRQFDGIEDAHALYWETLLAAVEADLGPHKPRRIGHLTLLHKYRLAVGEPSEEWTLAHAEPVLRAMAARGMQMDVNAAGVTGEHCRQPYPPEYLLRRALELDIPLVYGSDAHGVEAVGRAHGEIVATVAGLTG